jgi:hypothetical protein
MSTTEPTTLFQLSKSVKSNPHKINELLASFKTNSTEVRNFLFSLQDLPPYIVPHLLATFATYHRENDPKKVSSLMSSSRHLGCVFVLAADGSDWVFVGVSTSGKPLGRPIASDLIMELDPEAEINYVF